MHSGPRIKVAVERGASDRPRDPRNADANQLEGIDERNSDTKTRFTMIGVSTRVLLSISLVVTAVGALDAFISREWDLLSVFALTGLLQLSIWLQQRSNRLPTTLRPDLSHWLERRSQESGEPVDDILDRAVSWYQHGLYPHEHDAKS